MKIKVGDLNLRISNEVSRDLPQWFNPDLEFDFPMQVRAANIVLIKDYGGHTVIMVWLWESRTPQITAKRVGEVYFRNHGTEAVPDVLSAAKLI